MVLQNNLMLFPLRLSFYLTKKFFKDFFWCLALFTSIIQVFTIIDVFRKKDINENTFVPILKLLILKTPYIADNIMPYMIVLSVIYTLNHFSRSNELIIIKSVGISIWQIIAPIILSFFVFGIFYVAILNPFVASTYKGYNKYKIILGSADDSVIELTANGIWLKDKSDENLDNYIHAEKILDQGKYLSGVKIYLHDKLNAKSKIMSAQKVLIGDGEMTVLDATIFKPDSEPEKHKIIKLKSNFKKAEVLEAVPLRSVSVWEYNKTIEKLNRIGFSIVKYRYYFYKTIFLPFLIVSLVIFSISVGIAGFSRYQVNVKLVLGLSSALVLYFISNLIGALTELGTLPIQVAVTMPPLIFTMLGLAMIFHLEDG